MSEDSGERDKRYVLVDIESVMNMLAPQGDALDRAFYAGKALQKLEQIYDRLETMFDIQLSP